MVCEGSPKWFVIQENLLNTSYCKLEDLNFPSHLFSRICDGYGFPILWSVNIDQDWGRIVISPFYYVTISPTGKKYIKKQIC